MPRTTFPRITSEIHPLATGQRVAKSLETDYRSQDAGDKQIIREIIDVHQKLNKASVLTPAAKWINPDEKQEWKWINENKRKGYLQALDDGNTTALLAYFQNMFRDEPTFGLISSHFSSLGAEDQRVTLESHILRDLDTWREFTEQDDESLWRLNIPRVGNPYGLACDDGTLISVDTPRHDYFAHKAASLLQDVAAERKVILEVGGGYGGFCLQTIRRLPNLCFIDIDLPEGLYVTYYFLRKATEKRIAWCLDGKISDTSSADVILVPSSVAHSIDIPVHLFFNSNSLSEMSREIVHGYMALLNRLKPVFFLHQNANFLLFPNSERHIEVLATEFPIDQSVFKESYRAISPWQGAGGRYREFLYKNRAFRS